MDTSLLLFQGNRANLQMGLPNPSTAEFAQFKQSHSNIVRRCCSKMLSLWWLASAQLRSGFNEMSALSRRCTCAVQYGIHLNKSRPSQLQQTHCIQISSEPITENAEEIIIDPLKWNKKQHASFHTCCAHARGVYRLFFSTERIQDCTSHCIKRCFHSQTWPVLSIADQFQ